MKNKKRIYFTGCLKSDNKDTYQIIWYDKTIKNVKVKSFVFILDFDKNIYTKYKKLLKYNNLEYLNLTTLVD